MLIESKRHTEADLRLWHNLEIADRLNGLRPAIVRLRDRSLHALREFAEVGTCYASVSHGKDSTVLWHLVWLSGLDIPVWNLRISPTHNPHCDDVRDVLLDCFPLTYHEELVDYGTIDPDLPLIDWERETYRLWDAAWRRVCKQAGTNRHISGVRGDESGTRMIRMLRWGMNSPNTCAPLGWWKIHDVFGYMAVNDLPVHPNYAMLGGGIWDRNQIRTAEIGDEKGSQRGRRVWEYQYYQDVFDSSGMRK